jgi:hypothetical protein
LLLTLSKSFSGLNQNKKKIDPSAQKKETFITKNNVWLAGTLAIPRVANRPGRPQKQFSDASDRSKRRKTEDVRNSMDVELLIHATQLKLRSSGKRDASQVLKAITSSPTRATKYKKAFASQQEKIQIKMTSVSALAMFVEAGLSRRQYEIIRNTQKQIYPC